jgi:hypothetical protein
MGISTGIDVVDLPGEKLERDLPGRMARVIRYARSFKNKGRK